MDQNENITEKSPGQLQSPGLQGSASQAEEPGDMKAESPRKCKVCGGPNHYGCGCEAKQLREAKEAGLTENEAKALHEPETPEQKSMTNVDIEKGIAKGLGLNRSPVTIINDKPSEAPAAGPAAESEQPHDKLIEQIFAHFSDEEVRKILKGEFDFARDIKTMADGFEGLCACMFDVNQYLKVIAGDLITIRKILRDEYKELETEKTEPENAAKKKN